MENNSTVATTVKQEQPPRTDLFDAQLLLETATMRKDSAKYTADVISDLEEILRSPIKRKCKSPSVSSSNHDITPLKETLIDVGKISSIDELENPISSSSTNTIQSQLSSQSIKSSSSKTISSQTQSQQKSLSKSSSPSSRSAPEEDLRRSTRLRRTTIPNKKYLEYDMSLTSKSTTKQSSTSSVSSLATAKIKQEKNDNIIIKQEKIDEQQSSPEKFL